jgi:pantoate--beta-alanine ligase
VRIVESVGEMRAACAAERRAGRRIGFVPTMGYLHEGHLSLFRRAREAADTLAVSIFVNPIQFGPGEDYERYPVDAARDEGLCRGEKVDLLFRPSAREMYAAGHSVYVDEGDLASGLCGAHRPGHFRGVLTVVAKLFHVVEPDVAVFGQKDAQQVRLIEKMVRDLDFAVRIEVAPTVREPDGLAMSSRNAYLSDVERRRAVCLWQALELAKRLYAGGTHDAAVLVARMREHLAQGSPPVRVEYVEAVDWETLKPVTRIERKTLLALAVRLGATRLIDNALLCVADG